MYGVRLYLMPEENTTSHATRPGRIDAVLRPLEKGARI
jgi:hypothetical protein